MVELKVFVIADVHSPDSFSMMEILPENFDLVLTLGDISPGTIDYILFQARKVPVFGVLGNHDPKEIPGLDDIGGRCVEVKGIRLGGFGGAPRRRYGRYDSANFFSEKVVSRVLKRMPPVDVFISHAPPYATSIKEDREHQGFYAFDHYLQRTSPKYWFHGHLERNYEVRVHETTVIGVQNRLPMTVCI